MTLPVTRLPSNRPAWFDNNIITADYGAKATLVWEAQPYNNHNI